MRPKGSVLVVYCGCQQVKIESPRQRISGDDEGIRLWGAKMSSVSGGLTPEPFGSALSLLGVRPTAAATTSGLTIRDPLVRIPRPSKGPA